MAQAEAATATTPSPALTPKHIVRGFDYEHDVDDLRDICANVYGGTDYMPRIIHRITSDPGHLVLAAAASAPQPHPQPPQQQREDGYADGAPVGAQPAAAPIDAVICSERRGGAVFLYGLRVREGTRGRGLGHLLMEAICASTPEADAEPPALQPPAPPPGSSPLSSDAKTPPAGSGSSPGSSPTLGSLSPEDAAPSAAIAAPPPSPSASCLPSGPHQPPPLPPSPPPPLPVSHIVTVTTSYNPAAQRIIGRQLAGPLCEAEIWPGHGVLEGYERAAGWVRGRGVPADAPHMLDWIPGARQALADDAGAQALLPRWRRAATEAELRSVVGRLLYGSGGGSGRCDSGCDGNGNGDLDASLGLAARVMKPLLWLPMPYDVWPLDSPFVRRELAAGNVWLCTAPKAGGEAAAAAGSERTAVAAAEEAAEEGAAEEREEEEVVVGVMLLAYFDTLSRVCAGILAADDDAFHSAIAHAGTRHPHFFVSVLRDPARAKPPGPAPAGQEGGGRTRPAGGSAATAAGGAAVAKAAPGSDADPALPALYGATGGYRDFWLYARPLGV